MRCYMRRHSLYLLLMAAALSAHAQLTPVHNVASPEAGTLGTFGTVPVSHYTGVPDISIPLYDVKVGNFTLPLTARYHLSSVKPHTPPTTLGLGWVLDAGGYISRTVRGIMDEQHGTSKSTAGFYESCSMMQQVTPDNYYNYLINDTSQMPVTGDTTSQVVVGELAADEFSFSFCGYSGNFYRNDSGGWTVVSDHHIKVEFDESSGFMNKTQLQERLSFSTWNSETCTRFFRQFTLVTPDGTRFVFGGENATEFCINYYHRSDADLVPTTWRLSKVITPQGWEVELTYDTAPLMCNLRYVPQEIIVRSKSHGATYGYESFNTGLKGYTGFLLFPVILRSVDTPNEHIELDYFSDLTYGSKLYYYAHKSLGWFNKDATRGDVFVSIENASADQFLSLIPPPHVEGSDVNENKMRQTVAESLRSYMLHRICIADRSNTYQRSIYFDYNMTGRPALKQITAREGRPKKLEDMIHLPDGRGNITRWYNLPSIQEDEATPATWRFKYNAASMPLSPVLANTDDWGYSTGTTASLSPFTTYDAGTPNLYSTSAETLSTIFYPTGGQTLFKYELNDYSKFMSGYRDTINDNHGTSKCGGLRVAQIIQRDKEGDVVSTTKYYYTDSIGSTTSSGILQAKPMHEMGYYSSTMTMSLRSKEAFGTPSTNHNSPHVGYSSVIEQTFNAEGQQLGYTRYRYSNYDTDIFGDSHPDEAPVCSALVTGISPVVPFTSRSMERGKLQQKTVFDANGRIVRDEVIRYAPTSADYIKTAWHSMLTWYTAKDMFLNSAYSIFGWLNKTYTYSYLPVQRRITEYTDRGDSILTVTTISHNDKKMIAGEHTTSSKGENISTQYRYVCDDSTGRYDWMKTRHIVEPIVRKTTTVNGMERTDSTYYGMCVSGSRLIPFVSKVRTCNGSEAEAQTVYEAMATDGYGNPTVITENGVPSTMTWGFEGQRMTQRDMGGDAGNTNNVTNNLYYSYNYDNSLRVKSVNEPGKPVTFFDYDAYGRLQEVYLNIHSSELDGGTRFPIRKYTYDYRTIANEE